MHVMEYAVLQKMGCENGKQKGIRTILQGRVLFEPGVKLDEAHKFLASRPDFASQKPLLNEKTVELQDIGLYSILNSIQSLTSSKVFWGACEAFTRKHCDYYLEDIANIRCHQLLCAASASLREKSERYIDAYRPKAGDMRLTPAQVEYAVKGPPFTHRIPDEKILEDLYFGSEEPVGQAFGAQPLIWK